MHFIRLKDNEFGDGFSPKLHLDKIAPSTQTLFIDADCLITGNLDFIFQRFEGKSVSVVGGYIARGEWFGDVAAICEKFRIEQMPKFNGGIYYIEKGNAASAVYAEARELEKKYDEIGFVRLRGKPNDEVLMALAMALHNQVSIADDGKIMSDPQACPGNYVIDVTRGRVQLTNPLPGEANHQSWYPFHMVRPVIFHFLGYYTNHEPYRREEKILELHDAHDWNLALARIYAFGFISAPMKLKTGLKRYIIFLYIIISFGNRTVKRSERE